MINKKDIKDIYILSPMQEGMLFLSLYNKDSSAYFEQTSYRLYGELNISLIKKSLDELLRRYDVLRTVFIYEGSDRPIQVVLKERECDFYYECINDKIDTNAKEIFIKEFKEKDKQRSFDLNKDVLMRVAVIQLDKTEYEFIWSCHHIILDGWCMGILVSEFFEIYNSYLENKKYILPPVKPYRMYIQWLERQDKEESIRYWKNYLDSFEEQTGVPKIKISKEGNGYRNQKISVVLDMEKTIGLSRLAAENHATLNTVTQTLWGTLLGKYNGKEDVVFGAVVSGRPSELPGVESMVGLFINTIPVRIRFEEKTKFYRLFQQIQNEALAGESYHYHPLAEIQSMTALKQNLIDHLFIFENYPIAEQIEGYERARNKNNKLSLKLTNVEVFEQTNYDFNVTVGGSDRLRITFQYNGNVYDGDFVERISKHFCVAVDQVIAHQELEVRELMLLSEEEKNRIIYEFNDTEAVYPKDKTIHQLFEEQVERTPDSIALYGRMIAWMHGEEGSITYTELNEKSNRFAHELQTKGVGLNTIVGIMLERSIEMIIAILGILKSGGAYLPIDPDYPMDRIQYMLTDSSAKILLKDNDFTPEEFNKGPKGTSITPSTLPPFPPSNPTNLAYTIYTSGSTGKPKGVIVEHGSAVNLLFALQDEYPFTPTDTYLLKTSYVFDVSVTELFGWYMGGGRVAILEKNGEKDPRVISEWIEWHHITHINFVPTMFNAFASQLDNKNINRLSRLKYILLAGEALLPEFVKKFRGLNITARLENIYGPTEGSVYSSKYSLADWSGNGNIPIGKPMPNIRLYILDKYNRLQPPGIVGELTISGKGLARGYLNRPGLTAERFARVVISHSSSVSGSSQTFSKFTNGQCPMTNDRFYFTGDLTRWLPDGNIDFLGRIDQQVKIRGFRIELGEIESELSKHADIKEAVVVAGESEKGSNYLSAYIVCRREPGVSELREYLGKQLPNYMIPTYFIDVERIPLTPSGKVDRKALPEVDKISLREDVGYILPSSAVEKTLVEIWGKVLGRDNIGINENFFMLGGDSIKSIQIISRMSSAGYKLEMKDLFQYPVISDLAPRVKKTKRIPDQSTITGIIPLTPIQVIFINEPNIHPHHYNQAVMFYSREGFDKEALKTVFSKIQEHHDALRMTYNRNAGSGEVIQANHGLDYPLSLDEYDLKNRENSLVEFEAKLNEIQASIDLEKGPLMKLGLFHLDDGDRLLIAVHHLVIDGISWRILFEDIETLYGQYKRGEKLVLPLKTDSFKLWSEKLLAFANNKTFLKEKAYWQKMESVEAPSIPKDFDVDDNYIKDTVSVSFTLSEEETGNLLTKVNEIFRTEINDILLTALGMGIKKTWAHDRILIALEGHGREEILEDIDISRTIGWFTSLYPVLMDISCSGDTGRQIKEIKDTLRRIPNKGIGYGILKYLTKETNKTEVEFKLKPQISFNYMGQFDADVKQLSSFRIAKEFAGNSQSVNNIRKYVLDVSGMTASNRLTMIISFNQTHFKSETIATLSRNFESELKHIIAFCCSKDKREFTPSDFTYKGLPIETVDWLIREYPDLEDIYTLTPMQEGMLFHTMFDDSSFSYFVQMSYRLQGDLNIQLVEKSLNELVKRHDILRTTFVYKNVEYPVQVVLRDRIIDFYYEDISKIGEREERESYIGKFKTKDKDRSFELSKDVLMRVSILQADDSEYEFTWSFHHIVMDGWCIGILNTEFFRIYSGYLENRPYRLPVLKPYRTYIQWLEKQDRESSTRYWQNYLDSFAEQTGVPRTKISKEEIRNINAAVSAVLDMEKTARLNKLAGRNHVTLNIVIQTLWGILLGKYNGKEDVVFGAVVSGRPLELEGVESMVGLFINTIPVRIRFEEKMKFYRLLQQVQAEALAGGPYHYNPLAEIQSRTALKQNLIDHIFIFENYPITEQIEGYEREKSLGNKISLRLANVEIFEQTNYDLNVVLGGSDRLSITFQYNGNVYDGDFVERISKHFRVAVDQVIANQELEVRELTLLSEEEKIQVLYEFNDTEADYPKEKTIHRLFEEQVEKRPDNITVIGLSVGAKNLQFLGNANVSSSPIIQLSYWQLHEQSNLLAFLLQEKGAHPGTIVAIKVERSIEMVVGLLGIFKAGAAYLPIEPDCPGARIQYMLKDSGVEILLEDNDLTPQAFNNRSKGTFSHLHLSPAPVTSLAYIIYTSGSTGVPKGVLVEHRNVARLVKNAGYIHYSMQDRLLPTGPVAFDISTFEVWSPLLNGVVLLLESKAVILNAEILKAILVKYDITILHLIPQLFNQMAAQNIELFAGLRYFLIGGDLVKPGTVNRLRNTYPNLKIIHCYGPTENTTFSTTFQVDKEYDMRIPIGKPIGNSSAFIVDKYDHLQPVGVPGELCVGGDGLARGYLNQPDLTVQKFVKLEVKVKVEEGEAPREQIPNKDMPHMSYIYKTGDVARYLADGNIEFIGRIDTQVKIRGFRIELGEIESLLLAHKEIKEALVLDRKNEAGDKYLCAYFVSGTELGGAELKEYLDAHLPGYMIPSYFMRLEKIPLTPNGKIDRKALPEPEIKAKEAHIAPRNDIEEKLAGIWAEILGIEKNVISMDANFFQLGGHSLKAAVMVAKIHKELNRVVALTEIFKTPTIEGIASLIGIIKWAENKEKGNLADVQQREEIEL